MMMGGMGMGMNPMMMMNPLLMGMMNPMSMFGLGGLQNNNNNNNNQHIKPANNNNNNLNNMQNPPLNMMMMNPMMMGMILCFLFLTQHIENVFFSVYLMRQNCFFFRCVQV